MPVGSGLQGKFIGIGYHHVSSQNGRIDVPLFMNGRPAVAKVCLVHDIVMYQGEVMENFNSKRHIKSGF